MKISIISKHKFICNSKPLQNKNIMNMWYHSNTYILHKFSYKQHWTNKLISTSPPTTKFFFSKLILLTLIPHSLNWFLSFINLWFQQTKTNRKRSSSICDPGWRLAQLPSLVPLGLQGRGTRQVEPELLNGIHRFHGVHRPGLRPQVPQQGNNRKSEHQQGRWDQQLLGQKISCGLNGCSIWRFC